MTNRQQIYDVLTTKGYSKEEITKWFAELDLLNWNDGLENPYAYLTNLLNNCETDNDDPYDLIYF